MMKIRGSIFISIVTICISCLNETDNKQLQEIRLEGEEIKISAILNPTKVLIFDSILIIKEPPKTNKSIKLINLKTISLISNAIYLGRGPGELANPANMVIDKNNGVLWYSDWGKNKCFKFPLDSLVANSDYKPTESFSIEKGLIPMLNMFYHPSGNFGYSSLNVKQNLINFIDQNGERVDSMAIQNKIFPDLWENLGFSDNPLVFHYNIESNKMVLASKKTNDIAVIDENGDPIFQIRELPFKYSSPRKNKSKYDYRTFYSIESDQVFVFCLYLGRNILEYNKEKGKGVPNYPTRLLVFDWKGEGRFDIELEYPLMSFALDKENKRIIGSTTSLENGLVMYDISQLY